MKLAVFIITFNLITLLTLSQEYSITGTIVDNNSVPVAYANIILTSQSDSSFFAGSVSNNKGFFVLENVNRGVYNMEVSFMGFQPLRVNKIEVNNKKIDLGTLKLEMLSQNIDDVIVKAKKQSITYKVDRKIIDAESFPSATVAMDLLENVPSVQVDVDGQLTYRGDGTFIVFINGHPVSNGLQKLRQIPASKIERIEIITNPSAKYHAEGTAGIIQVILKKNRLQGYAITSSAKISTLESYNIDFNIDHKADKGGWYFNGSLYNNVVNVYNGDETRLTGDSTNRYLVNRKYDNKRINFSNYLEFGLNYDLTEKDYIDFSIYVYPLKISENTSFSGNIYEYAIGNTDTTQRYYLINGNNDVSYQYVGSSATYEHSFDKSGTHVLSAYVDFSTYLQPLEDIQKDERQFDTYTQTIGSIGAEYNEVFLDADLSYTYSISDVTSFETGGNINIDHIPGITNSNGTFSPNGDFTPNPQEPLNQSVDFKQDIYAAFLNFKSGWEKIQLQLGLRIETTDRKSDYSFTDSIGNTVLEPSRNRFTDFFPTVHFLYNITETTQCGVNYAKRIDRPEYWRLIPLKKYSSPYQYNTGNSNLKPAYTHSLEMFYKKSWDNDFIAFELFTRNTLGVKQSYFRYDTLNIIMLTHENVGDSWSTGAEIMAGVDLYKWWNVNVSSNLFDYRLTVDIETPERVETQLYSTTRINNTLKLPADFIYKINFRYNSPSIRAQNKIDGYFLSDMSLTKGIKDNLWQLTIAWMNVFNTKKYNLTGKGAGFDVYVRYEHTPFASFKVAYNFNNQK